MNNDRRLRVLYIGDHEAEYIERCTRLLVSDTGAVTSHFQWLPKGCHVASYCYQSRDRRHELTLHHPLFAVVPPSAGIPEVCRAALECLGVIEVCASL